MFPPFYETEVDTVPLIFDEGIAFWDFKHVDYDYVRVVSHFVAGKDANEVGNSDSADAKVLLSISISCLILLSFMRVWARSVCGKYF